MAATTGHNNTTTTDSKSTANTTNIIPDDFIRSGNGIFAQSNDITLEQLHQGRNPLCCTLAPDTTLLATGGADATVAIMAWGNAYDHPQTVGQSAQRATLPAPVITIAFAPQPRKLLAVGCMDGSVHLIVYSRSAGGLTIEHTQRVEQCEHAKYIRALSWTILSNNNTVLATSSADGSVQVLKIAQQDPFHPEQLSIQSMERLHLGGAVESLCFVGGILVCYARNTHYLSYFNLEKDFLHTKHSLNPTTNGGFDDHVSFCVMDMQSYQDKYLALATDTSRNIVWDLQQARIVQNLYGHNNDSYAQPKVGWSANGQYLFGNTQDEAVICVWEISSGKLIRRLTGHGQPLRDLFCSGASDIVVSTSFDKTTRLWFTAPVEDIDA